VAITKKAAVAVTMMAALRAAERPVGTPIIFELSLGGHNGPRWMQDQYQKRDAKVRGRKTMGPTVISPKEKAPAGAGAS
jgi:hypothetical protein